MRSTLRTFALACTLALVGVTALIGTATPSGAQQVTAADCASTTFRWLFWPDGHGDLASVPHAASDLPHLDVYSGKGKQFTEAQSVAYADGTTVSTTGACTPATLPGSGSASLKGTTLAKQLVCKFSSSPVFVAVPESTVDLPSLAALVDGGLVVHAQLGTPGVGSSLGYDGKSCKLKALPK